MRWPAPDWFWWMAWPFPAGAFVPIVASGFSGASLAIVPGPHLVSAPQPVGVTVYGWAEYESYGWPACFFFGDTTPPIVKCPDLVTVDLNAPQNPGGFVPCQAPVPGLR